LQKNWSLQADRGGATPPLNSRHPSITPALNGQIGLPSDDNEIWTMWNGKAISQVRGWTVQKYQTGRSWPVAFDAQHGDLLV
jgi:hypothetical protein